MEDGTIPGIVSITGPLSFACGNATKVLSAGAIYTGITGGSIFLSAFTVLSRDIALAVFSADTLSAAAKLKKMEINNSILSIIYKYFITSLRFTARSKDLRKA
jgi:hypothetical protein